MAKRNTIGALLFAMALTSTAGASASEVCEAPESLLGIRLRDAVIECKEAGGSWSKSKEGIRTCRHDGAAFMFAFEAGTARTVGFTARGTTNVLVDIVAGCFDAYGPSTDTEEGVLVWDLPTIQVVATHKDGLLTIISVLKGKAL